MKRVLSLFLALVMVMQYVPATVFAAAEDNLCAHHAEHTADCGYAEEQPGSDCTHAHSMECYAVNECAHVHGEECAEACGHDCMKDVSCWQYDRICGHEGLSQCGQECFQPICAHAKGQHDGSCGYAPATEAQPCLYECADCAAPEEPAAEPAPSEEPPAEPAPSEEPPAELTPPEEPSTETTAPVEVAHEHEYTSDVTQPTCKEKGYTTYTCACGDSYVDDYLSATGHKRSNGICNVCGDSFAGKKVSILSHSMSTYAGVSNNTAYNSTIGNNDVYYTEGKYDVYLKDTWWMQTIDAMGMQLLVNNSWSGSCIFQPRKGEASVGYGNRAVNLHNDHTGEEPDVILVYLGCNDFAYFKDTFGKADDVDYAAMIRENGDGTFTYAVPTTACEAYAIMLHKVQNRYPDAEIYCMTSTARREVDYTGDTYPDAGQPTLYSAELHNVAKHFGFPVIDLENAISKEVEIFDKYIGDKRAHANALGMDRITNEVISVMLGRDAEIRHVTSEDDVVAQRAILLGGSYSAKVNLRDGYAVTVTMDDKDITAEAYKNGKITIQKVTGDIAVSVAVNRDPLNFAWELDDGALISTGASENSVAKLAGTISDDLISNGQYKMETPVLLKHDLPWALEWSFSGDWRGSVLASDPVQKTDGMHYISRTKGGQLCFGTWNGNQYDNYGVDLSSLNDQPHTYRLENRIAADGSNMVWLNVDGTEIGPMNNYYIGSNSQNKTSDWISGKDFVFSYIGMEGHPLNNCRMDYIKIQEDSHIHTYEASVTAPTCTEKGYTTYTCACGDSYVDDYTDPRPLNVLMIGNSFSWDAADFWYDMQTSMTYDAMKSMLADTYDVHLAVMYKGSATLAYHATCAMKNTSAYTYTEIGPETNYRWMPSSGTNASNNILDQLEARDWDIIVIQSYQHEADGTEPRSTYTGGDARFTEPEASVGYLLDYFAEHEPNAGVYYYMPWATTKFYGSDTETGYHVMAEYTETTVPNLTGTNSGKSFAGIIPVGTGIQNARTTYFDALRFSSGTGSTALLKDPQNGLQYDSQHLSFGLGRYIAGIIVAETLIPQEMRKDSYVLPTVKDSPAVGELPQEYSVIGQLAAKYALQDPFKLTTLSNYDTELADRVCEAIKTADYSTDGITGELDLQTHVETVVAKKLENMGAAECSVTIHNFTLENGQITDMEATATLRVGYTSCSVEIIVTDGTSHTFGGWEVISVPSAEGPGVNRRVCEICGFVEEIEVDGSWQKFALAEHLQMLPDEFCSETNLWDLLKPEKLMINHLGEWVSAGSSVYSVTIPVKPGEKIYANSFDQTDARKGIQVSFIGDYGIVKTTFSSQTYNEFQANGGYLVAPEGAIAVNIPVWNVNADNNTINFLDYDHTYENGICTGCGEVDPEALEPMSMRYDDHLDMTGKTVEIIDAGTPTSYQVGYGVEENKVLDTAVVTLKGDTLVATGIGTAKVKIDDVIYEVTVTSAPISLLLLIGQSNMEGNEGEAKQSIVCEDGMVYATYGDRYDMTLANATHYAPSALTGEYRTVNAVGGTDGLSDYPVYMLTDEGDGRKGPDSGFAYEWVKQTGEKVWIVNAAHGGTSLDVWQPGTTQYEECEAMFGACQETLRKEIAAGHFTLSHMTYFWCQGCNDYNQTAEWYVEKYLSMHESLNAEMAFDHDGNASTPKKQFEFAGIIPVRAGHSWRTGYRAGTYTDSTNKSSYESFVDLQMTGPRVAQYWMCNNPELEDIVLVCNIGEDWVWMPDGTNGVSAYFNAHYPNGVVNYTTQVQQSASWYKPTTPNAVHDSIHYNQIGYNEVGRESVRNALIYMGLNPDYEEETTVKFVDWTGYKEVSEIEAATAGSSGTLVVPIVSPVTRSKSVNYKTSNGLSYVYYDLLAKSVNVGGTLNAVNAAATVSVTPRSMDSYNWNFDGTNLVNDPAEGDFDNPLTLLGGSVTNGLFNGIRYQFARSIYLNHDQEWGLEVKLSNWNATSGSMILSGGATSTAGQPYVYFRPTDYFVGFGYYDGAQYNNYGISLKKYGVACNEGSHTYRFVNRVASDGTNAIWLYVDNEEIAQLSEYYANSTLKDANSTDLSGKDFVLSYIGTSDYAVKGCIVDSIHVVEADYDPNIHLHTWTAWEMEISPSAKGPGIESRKCIECGNTQSKEVEGVWQKYDLDEHMIVLPDEYCEKTNLWPMLPHDAKYYHSGVRWDTNGNVHSVTFEVSGGEQIFATSFGKRGTNGSTSSDGIRLTFFGADGVLKTTSPQETYAEFTANGGYIIAPAGAVAVNVPMYNNSDANELYILNRDHCYENGICDCGAIDARGIWQITENGTVIGAFADLQAAVNASEAGGIISLTENCAVTTGTIIEKDLTIDGGGHLVDISGCMDAFLTVSAGAEVVLRDLALDGGAKGFQVDYDAVTYTNFTIPLVSGSLRDDPRAKQSAIISSGTLICENVDISNRYTESVGGAMQILSGSVSLTECDFIHNYGTSKGGALHIGSKFNGRTEYPVRTVTIKDCAFNENYSGNGGAIYAFNMAEMTITDSVFDSNTANGGKGGAIDLFSETTHPTTAMALGLDYMQTTVRDCRFENNWAGNDGYAIQSYDSDLYLYNSDFIGNVGVHQGSSVGTISTESFRYTDPSQRIYTLMDGCLFEGNKGPCAVYGDHNSISDLDVRNCEFRNNAGKDSFLLYSAVSNITNCRFIGETAESGVIDAIIIENYDIPPVLTLNDVSFTDCTTPAEILTRKYSHDASLQTYNVILQGTTNGDIAIWDNNAVSVQGNHTGNVQLAFDTERSSLTIGNAAAVNGIIYAQPQNAEAQLNKRFCVSVEAEGEGLKYQWYFRNAGSKNFAKSSVRDNTYDDVMTTARAGREVYCVITDANGNSVTTETAKLICVPGEELAITKQPENGEAVMGERFCVTVEAKGDNLKYQWYFRNKGATSWTKSGVRDNTYDDVMTTARADREIYCVITDAYGNKVTSDTVKLIRIPMKLEITQQPADSEASLGDKFCVTVLARGEGLKYQWYYRNEGGLIWYKSGVRDNTYDDTMTKARMGREVYCVITDTWGNKVTTETAKLIGVPAVELEILTQPEDDSASMGENFCITVEAQGDGLKYQWYFRNKGGSVWYKSGVKDNTYDDVMTKARAGRDVYCVITDAYGNQLTTQTAKIILK